MAVESSIDVKSVVWNAITWSASVEGGPLRLRYIHSGTPVKDRTGDDLYPRNVFIVDRDLVITLTLRELKQTLALDDVSNAVATVDIPGGTVVLTFANMKLDGVNGNQDRATLSEVELSMSHESADGQTAPIT